MFGSVEGNEAVMWTSRISEGVGKIRAGLESYFSLGLDSVDSSQAISLIARSHGFWEFRS